MPGGQKKRVRVDSNNNTPKPSQVSAPAPRSSAAAAPSRQQQQQSQKQGAALAPSPSAPAAAPSRQQQQSQQQGTSGTGTIPYPVSVPTTTSSPSAPAAAPSRQQQQSQQQQGTNGSGTIPNPVSVPTSFPSAPAAAPSRQQQQSQQHGKSGSTTTTEESQTPVSQELSSSSPTAAPQAGGTSSPSGELRTPPLCSNKTSAKSDRQVLSTLSSITTEFESTSTEAVTDITDRLLQGPQVETSLALTQTGTPSGTAGEGEDRAKRTSEHLKVTVADPRIWSRKALTLLPSPSQPIPVPWRFTTLAKGNVWAKEREVAGSAKRARGLAETSERTTTRCLPPLPQPPPHNPLCL